MGEFCSIRIAQINRDLRDMVDFVDVFPFLNHKCTRYTKQGLPLRGNYVCPAFNPPDIQAFLCVLRDFVVYCKQRGIPKIAGFFKGLILLSIQIHTVRLCKTTAGDSTGKVS
jgi:hypothetical protein